MKPKPSDHANAIALALCTLLLIIAAVLSLNSRLFYLHDTTRIEIHRGEGTTRNEKNGHSTPITSKGVNDSKTPTEPLKTEITGARFRPVLSIVTTNVGYSHGFLPEPTSKRETSQKVVDAGKSKNQSPTPSKTLSGANEESNAVAPSVDKPQLSPVDETIFPMFAWKVITDPLRDIMLERMNNLRPPAPDVETPFVPSSYNEFTITQGDSDPDQVQKHTNDPLSSLMEDVDDVVDDGLSQFWSDFFGGWLNDNRYEIETEEDDDYDELNLPYAALHPKITLGRRTFRRFDDYEDDPVWEWL